MNIIQLLGLYYGIHFFDVLFKKIFCCDYTHMVEYVSYNIPHFLIMSGMQCLYNFE